MMKFLNVSNVRRRENGVDVVSGVSFFQEPFQKVAIAGQSGSGKSTLLKVIAGLVQPEQGQVLFEQQRVKGPDEQLIPGHPGIAYLSQHYELRNSYRVEEILQYANEQPDGIAKRLYSLCQISHLLKRRTDQLSGGEKQRIALARLLGAAPRLLLLDEPYSNLDPIHKETLKTVIREMGDQEGISCILVSHDPQDTLSWADKILVMQAGRIVQEGSPREIYRQPVDRYVAGLFGKYNLISSATANAFGLGVTPVNGKDDRLLIRPEQIRIRKAGLRGTVVSMSYVGFACDLEVTFSGNKVSVRTEEQGIGVGDKVQMAIPAPGNWYIH